MTDVKVLWLVTLSLFLVAQSLLLALKILRNRSGKKEARSVDNPGHGERIAKLEEAVGTIKKELLKIWEKLDK